MTYNSYKIHLADPGYEMQALCNAAQLLGHILTIAKLGAIQYEGTSIMSLTSGSICHDVQFEMGKQDRWWQGTGFDKALSRSRDQHE